jgi:hypothetical protein
VDGRKITEEGYLNHFLSPLVARIHDLELDLYQKLGKDMKEDGEEDAKRQPTITER